MTQEEKAKHYDIALDKIKRLLGTGSSCSREELEYIFPELKESEDERIRGKVIATIHLYYGEPLEDEAKEMIAWLEKQGEHAKFRDSIQIGDKVIRNQDGVLVNLSQLNRVAKKDEKQGKNNMGISEATKQKLEDNLNKALENETPESWNEFLEKKVEQKPADKLKPKFKVGDRVIGVVSGMPYFITEVCDDHYNTESGCIIMFCAQNNFKLVEQKPADKVEPKFHKDDWIIHQGTENIYQVVAVIDNQYQLKYGDNYTIQNCADVDRCARLWDITKDAKDGDVLEFGDHGRFVTGILSFVNKTTGKVDVSCLLEGDKFKVGVFYNLDTVKPHPATKEQRDQLEKAMADAGYTFDFEKKELKKIEQKPTDADLKDIVDKEANSIWKEINTGGSYSVIDSFNQFYGICMQIAEAVVDYQNPAWSEEDEPQKELAETYLAVFDKKFPILPTLKGKQLADYKNFLNKCQQILGLKYWGLRPLQAKLFEKLSLLWATWGAEHLKGLGQTDGDTDNEKQEWSEVDESLRLRTIGALETCKIGSPTKCVDEQINWLKSLRPQN